MRALKSSESERNILVRNVCSKVRHVSPDKVDRSELMLCVATIGIHFACRDRAKNFSSPVGSFSPTVANAWYSSHRNITGRNSSEDLPSMSGIRPIMAR